jgi:hypothetical protein
MSEIKGFFNVELYDPGVLSYFEPGQLLEGRWGWLEVLRQAENGDRLVIFDYIGGCSPNPDTYWVQGPSIVRVAGKFRETNFGLLIVLNGRSIFHHQATLQGYRYQVQKLTHCIPDPYRPGYPRACDPLIQHFELKADINATHKYEGLRCDSAAADYVVIGTSMVSLLLPLTSYRDMEEVWDLIKLATLVANAGSREGARAAMETFVEEANMVVMKLTAKYGAGMLVPGVGPLVEAIDIGSDFLSIADSSGCRWLP